MVKYTYYRLSYKDKELQMRNFLKKVTPFKVRILLRNLKTSYQIRYFSGREGVRHYSMYIPPEISLDEFYVLIKEYASRDDLKSYLEIGSSSGEGSTRAIVEGIM